MYAFTFVIAKPYQNTSYAPNTILPGAFVISFDRRYYLIASISSSDNCVAAIMVSILAPIALRFLTVLRFSSAIPTAIPLA